MASIAQLQRQFIEYTTSLYNKEYLNSQFTQLEDESDPSFVVELVSIFLQDSEKLLGILTATPIGAQLVTSVCINFMKYCDEKNLDGCLWYLHKAKHEYVLVRNKLKALFKLEKQILQAGGSIPII